MNKTVYIHYGATRFDPEKGFPIKNEINWTKPVGGLWASRKDASFGWKDWCEREDFEECVDSNSFLFTIKDESKIATISDLSQLHRLPIIKDQLSPFAPFGFNIDFEKCVQTGIDAIELCWYGDEFKNISSGNLYSALYGWDCDSIVVLNPDAVIPFAISTS